MDFKNMDRNKYPPNIYQHHTNRFTNLESVKENFLETWRREMRDEIEEYW